MLALYLFKIFYDSDQIIHAYVVSVSAKLCEILSCNMQNLNELYLKFTKIDYNVYNRILGDLVTITEKSLHTFTNYVLLKFCFGNILFIPRISCFWHLTGSICNTCLKFGKNCKPENLSFFQKNTKKTLGVNSLHSSIENRGFVYSYTIPST